MTTTPETLATRKLLNAHRVKFDSSLTEHHATGPPRP